MKKLIFLPIGLLLLTAFIAFQSCEKQIERPVISEPLTIVQLTPAPCFTIQSHDGHDIGINGIEKQFNSKWSEVTVNSYGPASNLVINAISNVALSGGRTGCVLSNTWTSGGGEVIALYINGQPYVDGNSGYGLWSAAANGIAAEYTQITGGIIANKIFDDFVRTYQFKDTTGSPYVDSPITTYQVDSAFDCFPPIIIVNGKIKFIKKK